MKIIDKKRLEKKLSEWSKTRKNDTWELVFYPEPKYPDEVYWALKKNPDLQFFEGWGLSRTPLHQIYFQGVGRFLEEIEKQEYTPLKKRTLQEELTLAGLL